MGADPSFDAYLLAEKLGSFGEEVGNGDAFHIAKCSPGARGARRLVWFMSKWIFSLCGGGCPGRGSLEGAHLEVVDLFLCEVAPAASGEVLLGESGEVYAVELGDVVAE